MVLDFQCEPPWDLDLVDANLLHSFPMPACVVFARVDRTWGMPWARGAKGSVPLAPGPVWIWSGGSENAPPGRDLTKLIHDDGSYQSPYVDHATQGPTIVDRRLFFVTTTPHKGELAMPNTWRTDPVTGSMDKKKYDVSNLRSLLLHDDNLFDVYLGESLAPFVLLEPRKAALPVHKPTMKLPRTSGGELDVKALDDYMQHRWSIMSKLWEANKGKADTKTLIENLDWLGKLSKQLAWLRSFGGRPLRIAYTTSGEPTASFVGDNKALVDTKLYWVTCRDENEAYYLLAIINSRTLTKQAAPFRPKGKFGGARDLHKHLWKLPIPSFDKDTPLHTRLAELGRDAEAEAAEFLKVRADQSRELTSTFARRVLRHEWHPDSHTAQCIEAGVADLLALGSR